ILEKTLAKKSAGGKGCLNSLAGARAPRVPSGRAGRSAREGRAGSLTGGRRCPERTIMSDFEPPPLPLPETPWEAIEKVVTDQVLIEGRTFVITRPDDSDRLLTNPAVRSYFARDEYLPRWADLWPAARLLAKAVTNEPWAPRLVALEEAGTRYNTRSTKAGEPNGRSDKGTLYRMSPAG